MTLNEYNAALQQVLDGRGDLEARRHAIPCPQGPRTLLQLRSAGLAREVAGLPQSAGRARETNTAHRGDTVLIMAGLHGDEVAGPLSLLRHLNEIVDHACASGVQLIVYPLANPSGFAAGTRYADGDRGKLGNNDFLRYELEDGSIVGDIGGGRLFRRWRWSSDPQLGLQLPRETALIHRLLRDDPVERVAGVIDLHQDLITKEPGAMAYHYGFGDLARYRPIVAELARMIPIARRRAINAGQPTPMWTDGDGFLVRHDGTLTDLFYRLGAAHCLAVETSGATPLELACRVNCAWVLGVIDLVRQRREGSPRPA